MFLWHHVTDTTTGIGVGAGETVLWQPTAHRLHQGIGCWTFNGLHYSVLTSHNFFLFSGFALIEIFDLYLARWTIDAAANATSTRTRTCLQEEVSAKGNSFGKQTNPNTLTAAVETVAAVKCRHVK